MNSRASISGFGRPSRASRAMWTSWEVSSPVVSTVGLRAISPVASRSRLARSPNACTSIRVQHVPSGGQLLPRVSTPALVVQPRSLSRIYCQEFGA